jgi:hypothetical protein
MECVIFETYNHLQCNAFTFVYVCNTYVTKNQEIIIIKSPVIRNMVSHEVCQNVIIFSLTCLKFSISYMCHFCNTK